jgi:hypothetical protein
LWWTDWPSDLIDMLVRMLPFLGGCSASTGHRVYRTQEERMHEIALKRGAVIAFADPGRADPFFSIFASRPSSIRWLPH